MIRGSVVVMVFLTAISFPVLTASQETQAKQDSQPKDSLELYPHTQGDQIYKHPVLNIQFEAPSGWKQLLRPEDRMIHEIADPEQIVHVVLWYTETMQDGPGYMKKMAGMKDLVYEGELKKMQIDGRDAWLLYTSGQDMKRPIRLLLVVIHHEKPISHADHNALFVVQIWCPEAFYPQKKQQMEKILNSIRFTQQRELP